MAIKIGLKVDEGAFKPEKAHKWDAGYDLRTPRPVTVIPGSYTVIDTGVHMEIPEGYCGLLVSKSGLNVKNDITGTGLIDAGYTGTIRVKLDMGSGKGFNDKNEWNVRGIKYFETGDKIIQIIILPVPDTEFVMVDELSETERGDSGFGSTGR